MAPQSRYQAGKAIIDLDAENPKTGDQIFGGRDERSQPIFLRVAAADFGRQKKMLAAALDRDAHFRPSHSPVNRIFELPRGCHRPPVETENNIAAFEPRDIGWTVGIDIGHYHAFLDGQIESLGHGRGDVLDIKPDRAPMHNTVAPELLIDVLYGVTGIAKPMPSLPPDLEMMNVFNPIR